MTAQPSTPSPNNPPPIQAVCFDLGNVLVAIASDWKHACQIANIPILESAFTQPATRRQLTAASNAFETGHASFEDFTQTLCSLSDYTPTQVTHVIDAWLINLYPGVDELIDTLLSANIKTAVLSNTNPRHWPALTNPAGPFAPILKLANLLPSHLIGARKPDPAAYHAIENILDIPPASILFFDDLQTNINAATHQSWQTCHINSKTNAVSQISSHLQHMGVI